MDKGSAAYGVNANLIASLHLFVKAYIFNYIADKQRTTVGRLKLHSLLT